MTSRANETLPRIAVVEDDFDQMSTTLEYLRTQGYPAWGVNSAEAFYKQIFVDAVDVVVLDIGLPGEDGISVAHQLSERPDLTVIIVSARDTVNDRLVGLKAGADRYLVKPVDLAELVANIETIGRRPAQPDTSHATERIQESNLQACPWRLARQDWRLTGPDGKTLTLTSREFYVLNFLFEANGEAVARKTIADKIFGHRILNSDERLDVLLARLRKKCVVALGQPLPMKTVHQVGYAFTAPAVLE